MRHVYSWLLAVLWIGVVNAQEPNDHIFPEAAGASRSIHFDKKGFFIHGRRTFLVSAGMEYARVPRALWADRLLRLQRAGFNCVEVYTFWNFHEPREGQFEFSGDHDLDAFLRLVARMGMYAIVRVGPYYCAEWDNGGYPLWLKFKAGVRVREDNAVFEKYVGRFFDRVLPIVAANQIHRGGAVILVQLENEHPLGWGTDKPNAYFDFLQRKALALGIEVPYFFSGLHHSNDPAEAGQAPKTEGRQRSGGTLDDPGRPNPWFTTEFWSVWYNGYGSGPREARLYEERTWKIIQRGGGGYNYYMAYGGSNFGYTNNDEDAASYDYGAAVGQAGDLRPIYYSFKKTALFARSFADELAERRVHFSDSGIAVDGYVRLAGDSAMLLARCGAGLVVYGRAGSRLRLQFEGGEVVNVKVQDGLLPEELAIGGRRVLVMNREAVDRCWVIGDTVVCGPKYVGALRVIGGKIAMETEDTVGAVVYLPGEMKRLFGEGGFDGHRRIGVIGEWKKTLMTGAAAPGFDDRRWTSSQLPLQMGADGDSTADAWYRTWVWADSDGEYTLLVEGADRATAYLDGRPLGAVDIKAGTISLHLTKGRHILAVFTAHDGRDKLAAYIGALDSVARKGLFGRALLVKGPPAVRTLDGWRVLQEGVLKPYKIGDDVFDKKAGKAWFETELPDVAAGVRQAELRFASVDENADVYINDRKVARHEGWNSPFSVLIDRIDTMRRPVRLKVFIENYSNEGGIDQPVRFSPWASPVEVRGWKMKGGLGGPGSAAGPCLWKTEFTVPPDRGYISIWRVIPEGLGHGSVWVNGHNLGRYPEKIPVNGLYIPECWLRPGGNKLEIFDEDGKDVGKVRIEMEEGASRPVRWLREAADVTHWVNPFIGTAKSDAFTRWGNEGGTYPGAVAPWGYIQLTPETRPNGGYDYGDSLIRVFSCMHHPSGFPNGSAGRFFVMPFRGGGARPFFHRDEVAEPGYYRIRLSDDGTDVEMTADTLAGLIRISFPAGVAPEIFVGDTAGMRFGFSGRYVSRRPVQGGEVFSFAAGTRTILVWIGAEHSDFDGMRASAHREWNRVLSVVEVGEGSARDKTVFYTALYHSLLVPWVTPAGGYGNFSPWDTYRSLHPLLTLLYPDRQAAMMRSMMDIYRKQGHLPIESMTGNHAVAILVDAYLKGVKAVDPDMAYAAMLKSLVKGPFVQDDRQIYADSGYIPMTRPESVTRTVEYAYDDWVLGQYARSVMGDGKTTAMLEQRSAAWSRLLYIPSLLLLPRVGDSFRVRPGNTGYKEGDAWVYSYFAPQDVSRLIDRMGGDREFAMRLDSALRDRRIVFDNETVLHLPYLFNFAARHDLTIYWINEIRQHRYTDRPGGLPGNDDLGAMSSWYVFSALGFFPWCPGRPDYAVGRPLFGKVVIHLAGGKDLVIRRGHGGYAGVTIPHRMIVAGGELVIGDSVEPLHRLRPKFVVSGIRLASTRLRPGEGNTVRFFVENKGVTGVKVVRLFVGSQAVASTNCLVNAGQRIEDSIPFRWYERGDFALSMDSSKIGTIAIAPAPGEPLPSTPLVDQIDMRVIVRMGDTVSAAYTLQNTGWETRSFQLPIIVDDSVVVVDTIRLKAGERGTRRAAWTGGSAGWHQLWIGRRSQPFKVCEDAASALVLDLDSSWKDGSGFGNDGFVTDGLVHLPGSPSLNDLGRRLTMLLWVCPEASRRGLTDIFTNGDNHVLQVVDGRQLTFFAGGWGRGDCTVDLPSDWEGRWHLIAGVCDDNGLRVYIDGVRRGSTPLEKGVHLYGGTNTWMIGGNEEFPGQRLYKGKLRRPRIFQDALSDEEIGAIYQKETNSP